MKKEFLLYTCVSGIAWLVDVAILYLATLQLGMPAYLAAAIAYAIGLVVHYVLSVRYVFTYRRMAGYSRTEILVYALTGLAGIALSSGIVHIGDLLDLPLIASKIIATLFTFFAVFVIRKMALFSPVQNITRRSP